MKQLITFILLTIISGQGFGQAAKMSKTIRVNGIDMYYEVYGEGEPLFLLHGWTQSLKFWSNLIPAYAKHFKVYAIDLRGHGRTSQLTPDFSIENVSKDVLALIDSLQLEKVNAIGFSFGGLALLEMVRSKPDRIASMIVIGVSSNYSGGDNNDGDNSFSYENLPPTFIEELKKLHPQGEGQIKALFDPNLNYQIKIGEEELKSASFRTLIVQGDRDEILGVAPAVVLFKMLPHSELWIVPNTGHDAISGPNQTNFLRKSLQFLLTDGTGKTDSNKD